MTSRSADVPHSRENAVQFFEKFVHAQADILPDKKVYDLSAGSGYIANLFLKAGSDVYLFDLFPDQNTFCPAVCQPIDLQQTFPIADASADFIISSETIEHLPDQFFFFQEVARVLQTSGTLLLTTPNSSSLRSRFSQFLTESEHYGYHPPNEVDAFTQWPGKKEGYFGKLFISGVLRLRTLAALNGLNIYQIHPSPGSSTSWMLLIFYPLIYFFSLKNKNRLIRKDPVNRAVYEEIFHINTSLSVLTSKHLIIEFRKS